MKEPPGIGAKSRVWNSKTWHWCDESTGGKCGGVWRIHKPEECKGGGYAQKHYSQMEQERKEKADLATKRKEKKGEEGDLSPQAKKKLKLQSAMAATIKGGEESDDSRKEYSACGKVCLDYEYNSTSEDE